ncbi:hypothetical protein F5Y04DRAFT_274730 [Hypomontagnella monticulosa]|nr:hypothetical protein F5Y04DRAFT_274730 [Hypomontagnella monticulosa]
MYQLSADGRLILELNFYAPHRRNSLQLTAHKPLSILNPDKMGGGPRVPYPKHVWSPAGGWYAQPSNWKVNTAVFMGVIVGITAMTWKLSAEREFRHKMPEPNRFYPSRYWTRQIREHEAAQKAEKTEESSSSS